VTEPEHNEINLDRAWHVIHYCLTQDIGEGSHPLGFLLYGGRLAGDLDLGNGPSRFLIRAEIAEINRKLQQVSFDDLKANYEAEKMDDVYPPGDWSHLDEESLEYLEHYFSDLKIFISNCVRDELGALISIV